jgi:hypothetical protein
MEATRLSVGSGGSQRVAASGEEGATRRGECSAVHEMGATPPTDVDGVAVAASELPISTAGTRLAQREATRLEFGIRRVAEGCHAGTHTRRGGASLAGFRGEQTAPPADGRAGPYKESPRRLDGG